VVAADADGSDRPQSIDDAIGIGPIADHVAEMPDRIDIAGCREHRIEGWEVRMDVGQDGNPHADRA
jgi:hypothetical protein